MALAILAARRNACPTLLENNVIRLFVRVAFMGLPPLVWEYLLHCHRLSTYVPKYDIATENSPNFC